MGVAVTFFGGFTPPSPRGVVVVVVGHQLWFSTANHTQGVSKETHPCVIDRGVIAVTVCVIALTCTSVHGRDCKQAL
jgi:hypothetical protein